MGIDNNLYEKSIKILTDLISFQTISGSDNTKLIDYCEKILNNMFYPPPPPAGPKTCGVRSNNQ